MNSVCIIIPIYKIEPDCFELISLQQCLNILSGYHIIFVCHQKLDTTIYQEYCKNNMFRFEYFEDFYFTSMDGYNQLLLSDIFYLRFKNYKYTLIHQLDSFVFNDELNYWCEASNDYIGAPWFEGFHSPKADAEFLGVGNGGFSLRNTKSIIKLLRKTKKYKNLYNFLLKYKLITICNHFSFFQKQISTLKIIMNTKINEDHYFYHMSKIFKFFKVASVHDALKFSFEVNPAKLYIINNKSLPFGCHAWFKYDIDFWKPFINRYGYKI